MNPQKPSCHFSLLEKGKIKSDDDLSIFDDLIDNILVHMEKNDEIRNEINPVYLSMIENKEKLQNKVSEKVESLIGIIANNKEDENLGHKTKIFNELSEEEKVFFKANAKDIAIESISEIQEGISEEEKQNIAQKFDAFFKQIEEKPKKTYEQEEVINYLKNQLMYLGFGGQIIYSELGVSEFPKLKEYLVSEVGYKADEVAIITGATSKNQRLNIQEKFNEGKIKVIIGSEAIQEGMNLQYNTTDMYLLTLPYNFTSLRQTEGRAWRQGNKWENVRINFMLTNDSIDVFMLQKLQTKQERYMKAMRDGANIIDVSDVDTQELKTAIITDPYTRAEIEIKLLEKRYEAEKSRYSADLGFISRKFEKFVNSDEYKRVNELKKHIENYTKWAENNDYYKEQLIASKEYLIMAEGKLKTLADNLAKNGVNISDFEAQKQKTEAQIEKLDKKIKEELPVIKQNLITQYKQEKEERLKNVSPLDFVQERAEENKTFFKLALAENVVIEKETSEERYNVVRR